MSGDILHGTSKIGSTKNGCFSGGIFCGDVNREIVKTNGFLFADVILAAMSDYLAMKNTKGVSENAAGSLLAKIQSTRKQVDGVEDDEYVSIRRDSEGWVIKPSIHLLMSCCVLCSHGVLRKEEDGYRLSRILNKRIQVAEKPLEMFLDPRNVLLLKSLYELVHCGYYGSIKSHSRFEKAISMVNHDLSSHQLISQKRKRFVNLSQLLEHHGLRTLSRACDDGTVDFVDCSSARLGLKMSSLMMSFLRKREVISLSNDRRRVSYLDMEVLFADPVATYDLSYDEMEMIEAIILVSTSSTSLRLSDKTTGIDGLISTAFCDCFEEYKDEE